MDEHKQQGLVDPNIFISRRNELAEQLRAAKLEKERFLEAEEDQTIQQTQELIETLEAGPDLLDVFDGRCSASLWTRSSWRATTACGSGWSMAWS